jgi:hypothetical protein
VDDDGTDDQVLAELLAADARRNLEGRAARLRDVYAVTLFTEEIGGYFLLTVATEDEYARQRQFPAYASKPDEVLSRSDGLRWSVGDWHRFPDDEFVSEATTRAFEPLLLRLQSAEDEDEFEALCRRWFDITTEALRLARPLDLLPCTEDAIAFVSLPGMGAQENVTFMARTVPVARLEALFPEWERPEELAAE